MSNRRLPVRKFNGRFALIAVIGLVSLTITTASTNAAGLSFMDSVKEFLGFAPAATTTVRPMSPLTVTTVFSDDFSANQSATYTTSGAIGSSAWLR